MSTGHLLVAVRRMVVQALRMDALQELQAEDVPESQRVARDLLFKSLCHGHLRRHGFPATSVARHGSGIARPDRPPALDRCGPCLPSLYAFTADPPVCAGRSILQRELPWPGILL